MAANNPVFVLTVCRYQPDRTLRTNIRDNAAA
jgi:hypothetical protein